VLNLCTTADMLAVNDAWMLDAYIKRVGPPKHLMIVHVWHLWHRDVTGESFAYIPMPWGFWTEYEPRLQLNLEDQAQTFLRRYFPLYYQNTSLGWMIRKPWAIRRGQLKLDSDGFMSETKADPKEVEADAKRHFNFVRKEKAHLSAVNRQGLEAIGLLAERYGIKVYIAPGPIYQGLYDDTVAHSHIEQLWREVAAVFTRNQNIHWVLKEPMVFPKEEMQNTEHVTLSAAHVYTESLAQAIKTAEESEQRASTPHRLPYGQSQFVMDATPPSSTLVPPSR